MTRASSLELAQRIVRAAVGALLLGVAAAVCCIAIAMPVLLLQRKQPSPPSVTASASSGTLTWTGEVKGTLLVTIDKDRADAGSLTGALPGLECTIEPVDRRQVQIVSTPAAEDRYSRLVLRVTGHGLTRIAVNWSTTR